MELLWLYTFQDSKYKFKKTNEWFDAIVDLPVYGCKLR